ncbi:hypothetical protein ACFL2H_03795 [Planctomycetota bacterium]
MDKKLGKRIRQLFKGKLSSEPLSMVRDETAEVPQGCDVYRRDYGSHVVFVALIVDPMDDRFTVECAWSTDGKFPAYAMVSRPRDYDSQGIKADEPKDGRFRFRLCSLWEPSDDTWWRVCSEVSKGFEDIAEEFKSSGLERPATISDSVDDAVDDAVKKIIDFAIPYFETKLGEQIGW